MEYRPTLGRPLKEVLADLTFKQKAQYIWQFYKIYILAALSPVILLAGFFFWAALDKTEILFNGISVNVHVTSAGTELISDDLFEMMGGTNSKNQYVNFKEMDIFSNDSIMENDTASSNVMTIAAWLAVGDIDYMLLNEKSFEYYQGDIFWDLEEWLSEELKSVWADHFVEMDGEDDEKFYGAIDLTDTNFAKKYISTEGKIYIVFPNKADQIEKVTLFLNYISGLE